MADNYKKSTHCSVMHNTLQCIITNDHSHSSSWTSRQSSRPHW